MESSPFGCFLCNGLDHRQDACPERIPPASKAELLERVDKYVRWFRDDDPPRITPYQKRKLIEIVNAAFDQAQKGRKAS